jgi:hypothetical protein
VIEGPAPQVAAVLVDDRRMRVLRAGIHGADHDALPADAFRPHGRRPDFLQVPLDGFDLRQLDAGRRDVTPMALAAKYDCTKVTRPASRSASRNESSGAWLRSATSFSDWYTNQPCASRSVIVVADARLARSVRNTR